MDRMIVAVFDPPTRAVDGQYALRRLDDACSIALYASALIDKAADGSVRIRHKDGDAGTATLSGSAIAQSSACSAGRSASSSAPVRVAWSVACPNSTPRG